MIGLTGRVVVLSPHLDDAVLSLGASIHRAVMEGASVSIVTVLAGDPTSEQPAGPWDTKGGFLTAGHAARARREEDREACHWLGASYEWLPFGDEQYGRGADDDIIWLSVEPHLEGADVVLVPGFPLRHPDHAWLARMFDERSADVRARVGRYIEQPYPVFRKPWKVWKRPVHPNGGRVFAPLHADETDRTTKWNACNAYVTQIKLLDEGHRPILPRMVRYESARGGESVEWVEASRT